MGRPRLKPAAPRPRAPDTRLPSIVAVPCGQCGVHGSEEIPPARLASPPTDPRALYSAVCKFKCGNCGAGVHVLVRTRAPEPVSAIAGAAPLDGASGA